MMLRTSQLQIRCWYSEPAQTGRREPRFALPTTERNRDSGGNDHNEDDCHEDEGDDIGCLCVDYTKIVTEN